MPELLRPGSIDEAADLIARHGAAAAVLAGGTSLMRETYPSDEGYLIGVDRLGLDRVVAREGGWSVGAAVPLSVLRDAVRIAALQAATREIGGPAVQNMATVGGNLFARAPFGDLAPAAARARRPPGLRDGRRRGDAAHRGFLRALGGRRAAGRRLAHADRDRRAGGLRRLHEVREAPLLDALGGHGRRLRRDGGRHGERGPDRAERRERAPLPLYRGGAGSDRLRPRRRGDDGSGRRGRSGGLAQDRCGCERVVSPAHDGRLRPPGAGGARPATLSGRHRWKTR